ncbi:glycosyltransferase [Limnobacter sp.]|uniref:glycosyltransferase n=1 Tax=Limnobacter sp. TaxID=2003368 RepID=UPI00273561C9|nr:glycosyltransferase [Limnobacter sp.]MDP3189049.1 glycosyltransferase [Limnobacter sp.]
MPSIFVLFAFVLLVVGSYGYTNQPVQEPPWTKVIPGFAFSPYQAGQSPLDNIEPTVDDITRDLALLKGKTRAVRTYTVAGVFGDIPRLAQQHNINVALGAWLSADVDANNKELARLVEIAHSPPHNIVRMVVGNETILRKDLSAQQMIAYLDKVRAQTDLPVSTAEPWHIWLKNPELAEHVDYLAVHLLPFWEGIALDQAVDFTMDTYQRLAQTFPDKPIVITEVGWPSHGRSIKQADASQANQAKFLRRFIQRAEKEGVLYYVMEAFDQPWKSDIEGSVGGHWGVYNSDRAAKFEPQQPIIAIPQWKLLAAASIVVALLMTILLLIDSAALRHSGRTFLIFNAFVVSSLIIYVIYDFTLQYHTWTSVAISVFLLLGVAGVFVIVLSEAHEWAEAMWYRSRRRLLSVGKSLPSATCQPFVSVHVPAYEEPPEMLVETLNALARLDYPNFEVIVVDNNTANEATWRPVQAHCELLGERFRFFHVKPLAGYKAGALNYALAQTCEKAEVIAVIDADYKVQPHWLNDLASQFEKPEIAIVQAPQDYRDGEENAFKALCHAEYKGFFHLGMVTRNERNAIIQHGTMTMVRRSVLEDVGRWGLNTITEDTELGLRIFEHGHEAVYIDHSYGKGLIPDTFTDYKKQRYRWAYGAMQILREHAGHLLGFRKNNLNPGQRYHFFSGWLPWIADGFNLMFTVLAVAWSALMLFDPVAYNAPPLLISVVPIMFFVFKIAKLFTLYLWQVKTNTRTAMAATLAGLSLSYTIGRATLSGLFLGRKIPFIRTPKMTSHVPLLRAMTAARDESILAFVLLCLVGLVYLKLGFDSKENLAWCVVLVSQSLPFLAALVVSMLSALPARPILQRVEETS